MSLLFLLKDSEDPDEVNKNATYAVLGHVVPCMVSVLILKFQLAECSQITK